MRRASSRSRTRVDANTKTDLLKRASLYSNSQAEHLPWLILVLESPPKPLAYDRRQHPTHETRRSSNNLSQLLKSCTCCLKAGPRGHRLRLQRATLMIKGRIKLGHGHQRGSAQTGLAGPSRQRQPILFPALFFCVRRSTRPTSCPLRPCRPRPPCRNIAACSATSAPPSTSRTGFPPKTGTASSSWLAVGLLRHPRQRQHDPHQRIEHRPDAQLCDRVDGFRSLGRVTCRRTLGL